MAILIAVGFLVFVGTFIWAALRPPAAELASTEGIAPTASVSEALSDGRLDAQIFALGNRNVRLEIQFMPNADAIETDPMRPNVYFAMVGMNMNGFEPPLELVESGVWRANVKLPMAGRWVVNVGIGEDFAEMEFDAK
ncbi:MAG: hypothetical protein C0524_08650 [Rhodobacter sp.]|nr:hypothetical protein [Rhodobacter sp.]